MTNSEMIVELIGGKNTFETLDLIIYLCGDSDSDDELRWIILDNIYNNGRKDWYDNIGKAFGDCLEHQNSFFDNN